MVIKQYDIFLISLDPAIGREIKKSRPCVIISPEEMNTHIGTVIIAPMTTKSHPYPTRIPVKLANKNGWIALDQIRTIDKERIIKKLGNANPNTIKNIKSVLQEMLVD